MKQAKNDDPIYALTTTFSSRIGGDVLSRLRAYCTENDVTLWKFLNRAVTVALDKAQGKQEAR